MAQLQLLAPLIQPFVKGEVSMVYATGDEVAV
jgi:hypothetical protein